MSFYIMTQEEQLVELAKRIAEEFKKIKGTIGDIPTDDD